MRIGGPTRRNKRMEEEKKKELNRPEPDQARQATRGGAKGWADLTRWRRTLVVALARDDGRWDCPRLRSKWSRTGCKRPRGEVDWVCRQRWDPDGTHCWSGQDRTGRATRRESDRLSGRMRSANSTQLAVACRGAGPMAGVWGLFVLRSAPRQLRDGRVEPETAALDCACLWDGHWRERPS